MTASFFDSLPVYSEFNSITQEWELPLEVIKPIYEKVNYPHKILKNNPNSILGKIRWKSEVGWWPTSQETLSENDKKEIDRVVVIDGPYDATACFYLRNKRGVKLVLMDSNCKSPIGSVLDVNSIIFQHYAKGKDITTTVICDHYTISEANVIRWSTKSYDEGIKSRNAKLAVLQRKSIKTNEEIQKSKAQIDNLNNIRGKVTTIVYASFCVLVLSLVLLIMTIRRM